VIDAPMEVKGPVMSTEGTDDEAADHVDAEEPIEVGDLLDDPRTDVEALCLCALLWSATDTASDVSDLLCSTDFDRGVYGELFEVITAQVRTGARTIRRVSPPPSPSPGVQVGTAAPTSPEHCHPSRSPVLSRKRWGITPWPCSLPATVAAFTWRPGPWLPPPSSCPRPVVRALAEHRKSATRRHRTAAPWDDIVVADPPCQRFTTLVTKH